MKKLIVIADWADDTLPCQEIKSTISGFLKNPSSVEIDFVSSTPSTIHTGFLVNQIVTTEERYGSPQETVIFANCDPRLTAQENIKSAKGAEFIIIRLISGIYLSGPNAGYNFSFIKSQIDEIYRYPDLDKGSQFRSRDLYARVLAHLMDEMEDELDLEEVEKNIIRDFTGFYISHVDNYGNMKTTIKSNDFKGKFEYGDFVDIKINNVSQKVKYADNLFGGKIGQLVIYPGSSGSKDNPYLEISAWQHFDSKDCKLGKDFFNDSRPGEKIEILQK